MKEKNGFFLVFIKGVMGDVFGKRENVVFISNVVDIIYYLMNLKFVGFFVFVKVFFI